MRPVSGAALGTSEGERIGIIDGDVAAIISLAEFQRRLGVEGWIRLHPDDFAAVHAFTDRWVHFNLGTTSNLAGHRYAIVPIVRPGHRGADGRETLAYVDVGQSRVGLCIAVRQSVPLDQVTASDFAASLPNICTAAQLAAALIGRYARMYPTLSSTELLAKGCAITTIELDAAQQVR